MCQMVAPLLYATYHSAFRYLRHDGIRYTDSVREYRRGSIPRRVYMRLLHTVDDKVLYRIRKSRFGIIVCIHYHRFILCHSKKV